MFEMKTIFSNGEFQAFLNSNETSAFPEEQEYLIGAQGWTVRGIDQETKMYKGKPMEVFVLRLHG